MKKQIIYWCIFFLFIPLFVAAQKMEDAEIKQLINKLKEDPRGTYKDIRWFCPDGSVNLPKEYCKEEGGIQHARYKDEITLLGESNHIFLGQILAATNRDDFWDATNNNSRVKQYQLEKFLRRIDKGWVLQKGQYYRGAFQIQDEEAWGIDFLKRLLSNDKLLENHFFLIRQVVKDIPHQGENYLTEKVWAISKEISNDFPPFLNLRIKMHGQPDATDLPKVTAFKKENADKLNNELNIKFDTLITLMEQIYAPASLSKLDQYLGKIPVDSDIRKSLDDYVKNFGLINHSIAKLMATSEKLFEIREKITSINSRAARLALLDISIALEEIYFHEINTWKTESLEETIDKICYSGLALTGTGFVENWEWKILEGNLSALPVVYNETDSTDSFFSIGDLLKYQKSVRQLVEWGSSMPHAVYQDVVELYGGFEPLAYGFYDERIHNSILLNLGQMLAEIGNFIAKEVGFSNQVMNLTNQSAIRGLNPGYAKGELVVIENGNETINIFDDKIYVFDQPPIDLKPVAGIATVSQGNMVSHIQLLARNSGIPNAVLSQQNLKDLKVFSGQTVFYAVSNKGTVILKPEDQMTSEERLLFTIKKRNENKVYVPIEKIDLNQTKVINMRDIDASASGKICGPKAANLAELKKMFPDKVVEGIVIPFGVFRQHLDQPMPRQKISYWSFLETIFKTADQMQKENASNETIENYVLSKMEILRTAFKEIKFRTDFYNDLKESFKMAFGSEVGKVPVFVRSDTNMEDLKEFTGAGLNRSLFNVVDFKDILRGIREVWASPYTERSYKWRQHYLLNPENVFPSILIIPSVDVEYSGVLVTKGIPTGDQRDLTIAFSRGAGGAVDGQAAESWLLNHNNENLLLAPAREAAFRRLPTTGGTSENFATFETPILNDQNKYDLRVLAYEVYLKFSDTPGFESGGPYDIELGFKDDEIWLFQIRPFVENKNAQTSEYLESITPKIDLSKKVNGKAMIIESVAM
jgi:pyruvate phosphate dikinase-like enzyme